MSSASSSSGAGGVAISDFLLGLDPAVAGVAADILKDHSENNMGDSPGLISHNDTSQDNVSTPFAEASRRQIGKALEERKAITNGEADAGTPCPVLAMTSKVMKSALVSVKMVRRFDAYEIEVTDQLRKACECLAVAGFDLDFNSMMSLDMASLEALLPDPNHIMDRVTLNGACRILKGKVDLREAAAEKVRAEENGLMGPVTTGLNLLSKATSFKPKVILDIGSRMAEIGLKLLPIDFWPHRKLVDALQACIEGDSYQKAAVGEQDPLKPKGPVPYISFPQIKINGKLVYDQLMNWNSKLGENVNAAEYTNRIDVESSTPPFVQLLDKEARANSSHPFTEEHLNQYEHATLLIRFFLALAVVRFFKDDEVFVILLTHMSRVFQMGIAHGSYTAIRWHLP